MRQNRHCQLANDDHPKNLFANKIHHLGCVIKRVSPKWLHNEDKKTLENSSRKLKKNSTVIAKALENGTTTYTDFVW